jgi:predicted Mrr-cat superfamily restriction endonuclease
MNTWYINTNEKHCKKCYEYMLKQNKIVSWYNSAIDKVKEGDLILLYHNQIGFIAIGFAISNPEYNEEFKEENFVEVSWICKTFDNPINHNDIEFKGAFSRTAQKVTINYKRLFIEMAKRATTISKI